MNNFCILSEFFVFRYYPDSKFPRYYYIVKEKSAVTFLNHLCRIDIANRHFLMNPENFCCYPLFFKWCSRFLCLVVFVIQAGGTDLTKCDLLSFYFKKANCKYVHFEVKSIRIVIPVVLMDRVWVLAMPLSEHKLK